MNELKIEIQRAIFLESELEEITFTYYSRPSQIVFSDYSCSMLCLPKVIEKPFDSKILAMRLKSESLNEIVSKMDLTTENKKEMEIQFMNKPFLLKYQPICENQKLLAVICILKEKMNY